VLVHKTIQNKVLEALLSSIAKVWRGVYSRTSTKVSKTQQKFQPRPN